MAQFPEEQSDSGSFVRQEDAFRHWINAKPGADFPAEAGRYHLYVSLACPWAHRTLITRNLLGLQHVIGMTVVDPVRDERGWAFGNGPGHTEDPVNGFKFLSEAYRATDPHFRGRVTVPVLWDKQTARIVNNSEDDICRMFADGFAAFHVAGAPNLFPDDVADEQEALSDRIYANVNNGVYEAGFASTQASYELGAKRVFQVLGELEDRLTQRRFLLGAQPVETDWRLFCTLIRFDPVYHGHFKCNLSLIRDLPALSGYVRELYQMEGIADTVNFDHIKRHYYVTHDDINPTRVVPIGPDLDWLMEDHCREGLG